MDEIIKLVTVPKSMVTNVLVAITAHCMNFRRLRKSTFSVILVRNVRLPTSYGMVLNKWLHRNATEVVCDFNTRQIKGLPQHNWALGEVTFSNCRP